MMPHMTGENTTADIQQPAKLPTSLPGKLCNAAGRVAIWVSVATLLLVTASLPARMHWRFELASHFMPLYFAASTGCALLLALAGRWRWLAIPVVVVAIALPQVLPHLVPGGRTDWSEPSLRVLFANVQTANQNYTELIELIDADQPDVIALAEINVDWSRALASLQNSHPYSYVEPRSDNFGIAIYSKLPMHAKLISFDSIIQVPSIEAEFAGIAGDESLRILVTHPVPPVSGTYARSRDRQLMSIAVHLGSTDDAVLVVGDLNVTPWSPRFKDLCSQAGLIDCRRGRGIHGTWPSMWFRALRLPLDHVLSRGDIDIVNLRVGPNVGSDHLPVIADIR